MLNTTQLSEKNLKAEIFSVPIVADELERMWNQKRGQVAEVVREINDRKPRGLVFYGSGGSSSALYSGYWAGLRYLKLPVHYLLSPDITSARPAALDPACVAIGASYFGKTVDTIRVKNWLLERNVLLFSITRRDDVDLAKGATWSITYESIALYTSPAYLTMILVVELARLRGEWSPELEAFEMALQGLPGLLRRIYEPSREMAERKAPELDEGKLVVLSGGAAYALGYMMAYDMFGEYLKMHCAYIHCGEFRHGPLEIIRRGEPNMLFLVGNDGSRLFSEAGMKFCSANGAGVVAFDARDLVPDAHPLLDALILYNSQLWLLYYMACRRSVDLDDYKYMHVVPYAEGDTFF